MKRVCVRAILRDGNNRICLIRRVKQGNEYWVTPGGGVEEEEDFISALQRELMEETGSLVRFDKHEPVFCVETIDAVHHFFTCQEMARGDPVGDEHRNSNPDNSYEVQFLNIDEIKNLKLMPVEIREKYIFHVLTKADIQKIY